MSNTGTQIEGLAMIALALIAVVGIAIVLGTGNGALASSVVAQLGIAAAAILFVLGLIGLAFR